MQCFEYLAIQRYARRHLGEWARRLDDLELAEALDERAVNSIEDVERIGPGNRA